MKKIVLAAGAVLAALALAGCAEVNTQPDEVALRYSGGFGSAQFMNCVNASTKNYTPPGDAYYTYPYGQRTFTFDKGGEEDAIQIVTKDNVTMTVAGSVTFKLNTDCGSDGSGGPLRQFHENIGIKYSAFFNDADGPNQQDAGWVKMLTLYVGNQIQRAANDAAKEIEGRMRP